METCKRCNRPFEHDENSKRKMKIDERHVCSPCREKEKGPVVKALEEEIEAIVKEYGYRMSGTKKSSLRGFARKISVATMDACANQVNQYGYRFIVDTPVTRPVATEIRQLKAQVG